MSLAVSSSKSAVLTLQPLKPPVQHANNIAAATRQAKATLDPDNAKTVAIPPISGRGAKVNVVV